MSQVVLATSNQGKVAEMQQTLSEFGFEVLAQTDFDFSEAVEDGLSFVENAIKKARHACLHTRLPAIADDSGLEVNALFGAPGIYSARYSIEETDEANNQKLLDVLKDEKNRKARFQCVLVYMQHANDPTPIICQGTWEGEIAMSEVGDNGFGYDPLFYIPELKKHSAELEPDIKKKVSHRAKALALLKTQLANIHELKTR